MQEQATSLWDLLSALLQHDSDGVSAAQNDVNEPLGPDDGVQNDGLVTIVSRSFFVYC